MTETIPLLHDDFERCDECGEIVLIHGRGACLELDDAIYCPRHARPHMADDDWKLRWGRAMELLDAVREDPSKAVKYALRGGVGHYWVVHDQDDIYQQWRRCEDNERNNYTTISESSLVRNFERRSSIGAYVGDPPHLVDVADAPINADATAGKKVVTDGGQFTNRDDADGVAVHLPPQYDLQGNRQVWFIETGRQRFDDLVNGALFALSLFVVFYALAYAGGAF